MSIKDFLENDRGFVWVEVAEVRVCSSYFSPNDPFEISKTQILLLEESVREVSGRSLIVGDFNSMSPEWVEARLYKRGILVSEMIARNNLIVSNRAGILPSDEERGGRISTLRFLRPVLPQG